MRGTTITFCAKLPVILNADPNAIKLDDHSFQKGSLSRISFVRPSKLFTANKEFEICDIDGILDYYKQGPTRRHHACSFCKYNAQNQLIDTMLRPTKHNEFA